jgi:Flagellar basal-body P-ring protein
VGNASSLAGGTLLMTPLKGADGQTYAVAQGNVVVSGFGRLRGQQHPGQLSHRGHDRQRRHGRTRRGEQLRQGRPDHPCAQLPQLRHRQPLADSINQRFGAGTATALNAGVIQVNAPLTAGDRTAFLGQVEALDVSPESPPAKVVIDARSGTVVLGQNVTLGACAVAHGNLSVTSTRSTKSANPTRSARGRRRWYPKPM